MNKIGGLEECIIPGILETVEDARNTIYETVRTGKEINPENIINEIVYRMCNRIKDERNLPSYKNNIILLETKDQKIVEKNTLDWFKDSRYSGKIDSFNDIKQRIIKVSFGEIPIPFFDYVQRRLNETGKQRIGGEKLKDAFIFVHTARALGILSQFEAELYTKILLLFHDVVEDRRDWRYGDLIRKINKGYIKYGPEEKAILKIENQPEFKEILDLVSKYDFGNKFYSGPKLANLLGHDLKSITKNIGENYQDYVNRMYNRCFSKGITKIVESLTSDHTKQMDLYLAIPKAKLADSIDNTIRVREGDMTKKTDRLSDGLILINETDSFLDKYKLKPKIPINLRKKLIKKSQEEITSVYQQYKGDKDLAVEPKLAKFREIETEYNSLKKYLNVNK